MKKILDCGFLRDFNTTSAYGTGSYFARDASYSSSSGYSPPNGEGIKSMFLVRILVGEPCVGRHGMQVPAEKCDGSLHESMVDKLADPSIFVLGSGADDHAYPEFVITFK